LVLKLLLTELLPRLLLLLFLTTVAGEAAFAAAGLLTAVWLANIFAAAVVAAGGVSVAVAIAATVDLLAAGTDVAVVAAVFTAAEGG
jgi:hypothetical protein